jgi:hypothetical protein
MLCSRLAVRSDIYQRDGAGPGPLASAVPAEPLALPQE